MPLLDNPPRDTSLSGVAIFEKDKNGDLFTVWNHPPFKFEEIESLIHSKSGILKPGAVFPLIKYTKYKETWIYLNTQTASPMNTDLESFCICLFTTTFNPEKYHAILDIMVNIYKEKNSATPVFECFLDIFTTGSHVNFTSSSYDSKRDHFLLSPLLDIIKMFEEASWIIWSALLMKKRVIVYSSDEEVLQKMIRAFPLFVLHRQDWNLLRPLVNVRNKKEMEDLTHAGVYIAGFTDNMVKQKEDLYDILVDVDNKSVTVAGLASDDFIQTKFHEEFSNFLLLALQSEEVTDQKLILAIKKRTNELIQRLQKLKQDGFISYDILTKQNLPPNMDKFLYSVASAEGMTNLSSQ